MTNKFKKFNSIENSYRLKFLKKIEINGFMKETFHVEEKIHGSNFQFNVSDEEIVAGKRTSFINPEAKDYYTNWEFVFNKYKNKIRKLKTDNFSNNDIILFGELYGGDYNHPNVKQFNDHVKVQKEVEYRPDMDFICFDILIWEDKEKSEIRYLTKTERDALCDDYGIPFTKSLFKGTLLECLEYDNKFQTTIPKELGLPEIENNICEGVVIRPEENLFLFSGERPILKNKNEKFTEKKKKKEVKVPVEIKEHIREMIENATQYVNENRLNAMISKLGEETMDARDFGLYIKEFNQDVFKDFFKDYSHEMKDWEKADKKVLQKQINMVTVDFLKKNLLPRI